MIEGNMCKNYKAIFYFLTALAMKVIMWCHILCWAFADLS